MSNEGNKKLETTSSHSSYTGKPRLSKRSSSCRSLLSACSLGSSCSLNSMGHNSQNEASNRLPPSGGFGSSTSLLSLRGLSKRRSSKTERSFKNASCANQSWGSTSWTNVSLQNINDLEIPITRSSRSPRQRPSFVSENLTTQGNSSSFVASQNKTTPATLSRRPFSFHEKLERLDL